MEFKLIFAWNLLYLEKHERIMCELLSHTFVTNALRDVIVTSLIGLHTSFFPIPLNDIFEKINPSRGCLYQFLNEFWRS